MFGTLRRKIALARALAPGLKVLEDARMSDGMKQLLRGLGHAIVPALPLILGYAFEAIQHALSGSNDPKIAAIGVMLGGVLAYMRTAPKDQAKG